MIGKLQHFKPQNQKFNTAYTSLKAGNMRNMKMAGWELTAALKPIVLVNVFIPIATLKLESRKTSKYTEKILIEQLFTCQRIWISVHPILTFRKLCHLFRTKKKNKNENVN